MNLEERWKDCESLLDNVFRDPGEQIDVINTLDNMGFYTSPASTKFHGNYEGGLYDHSAVVTKVLVKLTEDNKLSWSRPESPYIIGLFHDLCKMDQYTLNPLKTNYIYNKDTLLKGHGDKSVMLASMFISLTLEEIACIRYHMGAFCEKEEWNDYTNAIHQYPNVLWTHTADMIASHCTMI